MELDIIGILDLCSLDGTEVLGTILLSLVDTTSDVVYKSEISLTAVTDSLATDSLVTDSLDSLVTETLDSLVSSPATDDRTTSETSVSVELV